MSIRTKILALVVVLFAFAGATAAGYHVLVGRVRDMAARQTSEMLLEDYRAELKDLVDAIAPALAAAAAGARDEREVHAAFNGLVKNARYFADRSGYYFIYKAGGTVVVLPTLPDLEGKNIMDRVDARGTPYIRKLDQVAQGGGGYVEYQFDKPGKGVTPKISYARMVPGTSYWVGTGVYVDDVQAREATMVSNIRETTGSFLWRLYLAVGNGVLVVVIPLVVYLVVSIIRPLKQLTDVADAYSMGRLDLAVPGQQRSDEIGSLSRALSRLGISMKKAMQLLRPPGESGLRDSGVRESAVRESGVRPGGSQRFRT